MYQKDSGQLQSIIKVKSVIYLISKLSCKKFTFFFKKKNKKWQKLSFMESLKVLLYKFAYVAIVII